MFLQQEQFININACLYKTLVLRVKHSGLRLALRIERARDAAGVVREPCASERLALELEGALELTPLVRMQQLPAEQQRLYARHSTAEQYEHNLPIRNIVSNSVHWGKR